jgi:uncharacterized membrane protein YtjA (UPF0391 family)
MIRAALAFFVIGLIAFALGANGIAGVSVEAGKVVLFVFLALSVISFLFSFFTGKRTEIPN